MPWVSQFTPDGKIQDVYVESERNGPLPLAGRVVFNETAFNAEVRQARQFYEESVRQAMLQYEADKTARIAKTERAIMSLVRLRVAIVLGHTEEARQLAAEAKRLVDEVTT